MTTPTQAQIEAAWSAYYRQGGTVKERIEAALTAAAEVAEKDLVREIDRKGAELAAAHIADTIERCAQVAESTTYMSGAHIAAAIRKLKEKP